MKKLFLPLLSCLVLAACTSTVSPQILSSYSPDQVYKGYPCSDSCAQFETGYLQAERDQYNIESQCQGSSSAEIIGCKAYINEFHIDNTPFNELYQDVSTQIK